MAAKFTKYGISAQDGTQGEMELMIELEAIRRGGKWVDKKLGEQGAGLFDHYKSACHMLWPKDDWHRWVDIEFKTISENVVTVIMGPSDSGKTYIAGGKWSLLEYWADPDNTLVLISSTDMRGLELRIWGAIKSLFNRAKDRHPWLRGTSIDFLHCIASDKIDEEKERARVLNRGIVCIPCMQGGSYVGYSKYHGVKAPRLRQVSDESQLMGDGHLDSLPNYLGKDYKGVFLGNPLDPGDPLGRIAEPKDGWMNHPEPTKTTTWKTRMMGGECLNLVGTDSPNFDYPKTEKVKFPYLINWKKLESTKEFWGEDSQQYYSQCVGIMKSGLLNKRILTTDLCREHGANGVAMWKSTNRKKIYAVDAAYGGVGGDRCVGGSIEFGESNTGIQIIKINKPIIIPVSIRIPRPVEDQICEFVRDEIEREGIEPEDIFYDSTGRGTLGSAFARIFKDRTPVPVEFGGKPSRRPVRHDLFIEDGNTNRLKRCDEHYYDFVSELWFSVRYIVECDQMRELPYDVMMEFCKREYGRAGGNKFFVESKHDPKARERMGRSPDLADWCATACEGARQRGFKILRLGASLTESKEDSGWMEKCQENYQNAVRSSRMSYA